MHPDVRKLMDLQKYDLEIKRLRDEIAALAQAGGVAGPKSEGYGRGSVRW